MKDYSKQIMTIIVSCLEPENLEFSGRIQVPELSGILKAVKVINAVIQNEVCELEKQVVDLTEQLSETDLLLMEAIKTKMPRTSHRKSRQKSDHGIKVKLVRSVIPTVNT
jgi:hypothetical protein